MSERKFLSPPNPVEEVKEDLSKKEEDGFFESKLFRLITIALYLGGVGGMGFTLAMYYIFIWDSSMPPLPVLKH